MALSKEFDPKNGFMGGINIKPMGINNKTVTNNESPKNENTKEVKENKPPKKVEPKIVRKETTTKKEIKPVSQKKANTIQAEATTVNKGGRPKKYDVEKIRTTLFFPEDLLEEMEIAKIKFNGSRTDYIIDLVKKDLEANKAEYDALKKIFKK